MTFIWKCFNWLKSLLARGIILLIRGYQTFISPLTPRTCRYEPTCSAYFIQAVTKHGPLRGSILGIKRILSCHPFSKKDFYDPVP